MPNTAKFPAAIATNTDLLIATNRGTCTLNGTITSSATTILTSVQSPQIVTPCAISIDDEIILISSGTTTQLNVASGGRGFDGTTAASHTNAATIYANVIGWHHNQSIAEIEAIETFLGVNGGNINSAQLALQVSTFDWSQTPGGSLSIGSNLITLVPVPLGVNGSDANHYVYISNGSGTAEACLITGGTAVSGAPGGGTLIFSCANTHTGAWTVASDSGGLREAVLYSGGNATITIPSNTTILTAGQLGIFIDQQNLTILGAGRSSVVKARDNAQMNQVVYGSACDGGQFLNFAIDGNRANGGTSPVYGTNLALGISGVGGASHVLVRGMEIFQSSLFGSILGDSNVDVEYSSNYIHDNGGVTSSSGSGQGIYVYWVTGSMNAPSTGVRIINNYFVENHNTVINASIGGAVAFKAGDIKVTGNYCLNNYNNGGQIVYAVGPVGATYSSNGPALIDGNTIISQPTALITGTSGIESDAPRLIVSNNYISGGARSIALEGNGSAPGGVGAADTVITGNILYGASLYAIGFINAGGYVRGTVISGNRIFGTPVGILADSQTAAWSVTSNCFLDTTTAIQDNSTFGAYLFGNYPIAANLAYGGSIVAADSISVRPNQVVTVTGSIQIRFIIWQSDFGGTNGAGLSVTLIPAIGSTWTIGSTGGIGVAMTPVPGRPITLFSDGTRFWPGQ